MTPRTGLFAIAMTVLAACAVPTPAPSERPSPTESAVPSSPTPSALPSGATVFHLELPREDPNGETLPVDLVDLTMLVEDIAVGLSAETGDGHDVVGVADRADKLLVSWVGGACDARTTLTLTGTAGRLVVRESTRRRTDQCIAIGYGRAVVIDFLEPVDAAFVAYPFD
jgi:hypothetical protein